MDIINDKNFSSENRTVVTFGKFDGIHTGHKLLINKAVAIAEKEGIELTDEAYEEQLKVMAELYGYGDAETMKEAAEEEELREIALAFMVMDFVAENSMQVAQ